jgi:hypothetical protein
MLWNTCSICNILIYFCNIHIKHLQHVSETYVCNMRFQHSIFLLLRNGGSSACGFHRWRACRSGGEDCGEREAWLRGCMTGCRALSWRRCRPAEQSRDGEGSTAESKVTEAAWRRARLPRGVTTRGEVSFFLFFLEQLKASEWVKRRWLGYATHHWHRPSRWMLYTQHYRYVIRTERVLSLSSCHL